jgi:hypothetical protein
VYVIIQEIVGIFGKTSKGFLKEQKAFILSGVSERSLCGELMKYFTIEISKNEFSAYHVDDIQVPLEHLFLSEGVQQGYQCLDVMNIPSSALKILILSW